MSLGTLYEMGLQLAFLQDPRIECAVLDFFDLNTRSVRTIHVLDGPPPGWMGGIPVSPDGRWLLFAQIDELSSDLMMVENWR
jgi:hypothetical protein